MVAPGFMTESRTSAALTNSVPNERREQPSPTSLDAAVSVKVIDAFVSPSTPPPGSPCESRSMSLEARVAELESKLATLSKMLRTQQPRGSLSYSPPIPRSISPESPSGVSVPPLESPHPLPLHRRLSARLLHDAPEPKIPILESPCLDNLSHDSNNNDKSNGSLSALSDGGPPVQKSEKEKSKKRKWLDYLDNFQESTPDVDLQMEEFIRVPSQVEALLTFGFCICLDCFLYVVTMLPIRFVWSVLVLIRTSLWPNVEQNKFHRRHLYQLILVSIICLIYRFVLLPIPIGILYHWIRGQAMLKLYVLIAIVEVFDRLMCAMGQDCFSSMYWNTTRRPKSMRMLVSFIVVLCYATVHTVLLFIHVATLNVAMNSADHALLTLLISGNFAEIKSTVFKKYNRPNLFKITASDICERFKLALFLMLVLILNMCQGMDWKMTYQYFSMCGYVWVAELLADWIKHSFITKFNFIQSKVYPEYALLLAGDVTGFGHEGVNLDHTHAVVRRIGFAQIPMVCVMLRLLREAVRYAQPQVDSVQLWVLAAVAVWMVLFVVKLMLGSYVQRVSLARLESAPDITDSPAKTKNNKEKKA